jgi:PII-like signaling protein
VNEDCLKLTAYFSERERAGSCLLADALLDAYERHRIQTSVLLRGVEGYGLRHHLRTDRLLSLSEDLPIVSVALDTRARIEGLLDEVTAIRQRGLLTLERARMLSDGIERVSLPEELNEATKLTVYLGRRERANGKPAFIALCDLLRRRGIAGATALLGVDGTVRGQRERGRFFSRNASVPMMVIAVGSGERIGDVLPEIGELLPEPLVTLERVRVCKRDGELIERPHPLPSTDELGMYLWQKLMIYTSESAQAGKHPIHLELIRRLRMAGASGATSLRGVWGFHGEHEPHGDRLWQLRRRAPIVSIVVDKPERIAACFEIVNELTADRGLVTSEMVPAMTTVAKDERRGGLRLAQHRF